MSVKVDVSRLAETLHDVATFVPDHAVLHRPADHGAAAAGATDCDNDCVPLT